MHPCTHAYVDPEQDVRSAVTRHPFTFTRALAHIPLTLTLTLPTSVVDECARQGVECGGASRCVAVSNGFRCECAAGWSGGGDNRLCTNGQ